MEFRAEQFSIEFEHEKKVVSCSNRFKYAY